MNEDLLAAAREFIRLAAIKKDSTSLEIQSLMSNSEENEDEIYDKEEFISDLEIAISRVEDIIEPLT